MQNTLIAMGLALLVGAGGGAWLGYQLAAGDCAADKLDSTTQALQAASSVVEAGRESVQNLNTETAQAADRSAAVDARQVKNKVDYENILQKAPERPDCTRDAESFGLLVAAVRAANAGPDPDHPSRLPE